MQGLQPTPGGPAHGGKARDTVQTITLNQGRGKKAKVPSRTPPKGSTTRELDTTGSLKNSSSASGTGKGKDATSVAVAAGSQLSSIPESRRYNTAAGKTPRPANTLPHHLLAAGFVSPRASFNEQVSSRGRKRKSPTTTAPSTRAPRIGTKQTSNSNNETQSLSSKSKSSLTPGRTIELPHTDLSSIYSTPTVNVSHITASGPAPLGLRLKKTPSLVNLISQKLQKSGSSGFENNSHGPSLPNNDGSKRSGSRGRVRNNTQYKQEAEAGPASGTPIDGKLKASTINATRLLIGDWQRICRYEGDVVFKCYYAKQKLVWEVLEAGLKSKVEIHWLDITSLRAYLIEGQPSSLEVYLSKPPAFFKESNPQPRKHTLWHECKDFTNGEASACKKHSIFFPSGVLGKHLEKLLQCDSRLRSLCQIIKSPRPDNSAQPLGLHSSTNMSNNNYNMQRLNSLPVPSTINTSNYSVPAYPPHLPSFNRNAIAGNAKKSKSKKGSANSKAAKTAPMAVPPIAQVHSPRTISGATSDSTPSSSECIDDDLMFGTLLGNTNAFDFGKENDFVGSLDISEIDYSLEGLQFDNILGSPPATVQAGHGNNSLKTTSSINNLADMGSQQPEFSGANNDGRPSMDSTLLLHVPRVESQGALVLKNDEDGNIMLNSLPETFF